MSGKITADKAYDLVAETVKGLSPAYALTLSAACGHLEIIIGNLLVRSEPLEQDEKELLNSVSEAWTVLLDHKFKSEDIQRMVDLRSSLFIVLAWIDTPKVRRSWRQV